MPDHFALVLDLAAAEPEEADQLIEKVRAALAGHEYGFRLQVTAFIGEGADRLQEQVGFTSASVGEFKHF